jgi:hypothetical protein
MYGRVLGICVVATLAAGCGGSGGQADGASASPRGSVSSPPVVSPPPTPNALPAAADGERLSACHKGRCEVLVSPHDKIHPPSRLGVETVTIESVTKDGVSYAGAGPGITLGLRGQTKGMTSYMNRLAITTVAIGDGQAVVRFAAK